MTPAATAPRAATGFGALPLAAQFDSLDKLAFEPTTAQRALDMLGPVSARAATQSDRARVAIVRAQAYGALSQDERSCNVLKAALGDADATHAAAMRKMLENCN